MTNVLIPMIRKIIPGMIANDIVGVQPMSGPTGLIFSMRARYGNRNEYELYIDEMEREMKAGDSDTEELIKFLRSKNPEITLN